MAIHDRHKAWLQFLRRIVDVPLGYSREDLIELRDVAKTQYRILVPLIEEYIQLADKSESNAHFEARSRAPRRNGDKQTHLFDLLRDKRLFPANSELSRFASRILPDMKTYRFDKMSRGDIASRIIEYLETLPLGTRERLESSMRDALTAKPGQASERRSFLEKWENIIKGIEL